MPELASLLPIVAIALLFWLLIIRPASRRQKETARMQAALEPGQRVMLASGIYGVITGEREDRLMVQVADGVVLEVARGAIANVVRSDATPEQGDQTTTEES